MIPYGYVLLVMVVVGVAIGVVTFIALMKVSHDRDHQARKLKRSLDPFSDVTVTR
jgi:hypothetical protein